jgi:hypothetical protein
VLLGSCCRLSGGRRDLPLRHRYRTATEQRPGDPEAGYTALVNAPYVSCGIPYDAFRRVVTEVDPGDMLPGREGLNADLPYAFTAHENADGVTVVASNCLTCHAAEIEGR